MKRKPVNGQNYWYYSTKFECAKEITFRDSDTYSLLNWSVGNLFYHKDEASSKGRDIMANIKRRFDDNFRK